MRTTSRTTKLAAAGILLCLLGSCSLVDGPTAFLLPRTRCCRTLSVPGGWRLANDPARAAGYFADDPEAKLVYRFDPSSREVQIGLELPASEGKPAEMCPRHFAVSLASGGLVAVRADRWERSRPIVIPRGFWNGSASHLSAEIASFARRTSQAAGERSTAVLSPDSRFLVVRGRTGSGAMTEMGDTRRGTILLDVYATASGKRLASARGWYFRADPDPLLTGEAWISDRHLIFPSRTDKSELILCDFGADSPAGDPVIPVAPERPELVAFDPGSAESWSGASEAFPLLTAIGLMPEDGWQLQWRATNPLGRNAVVLVPGALGASGFVGFETPIPGNDLRDGPYLIGDFAFLQPSTGTRLAFPGVQFLTPAYRYPRPDFTAAQAAFDRLQQRPPSRVPSHQPSQGMELQFSGSISPSTEGAATVYTIDCLTKETPAPIVGFGTSWDLPGANAIAKPDIGPCTAGATKLYFTPPASPPPPGRYMIGIEARAGNEGWSTSEEWVVKGPGDAPAEQEPQPVLRRQASGIAPVPVAVVPYWGRGSQQRFSFVAFRRDGAAEIAAIEVRFAMLPLVADGCRFRLDTGNGGVRLLDASGRPVPQLESDLCRVSLPELKQEGNSVTASAQLEFKPALAGPHGVFVSAVDRAGLASPLELLGAWEVR